tara:strand:- start:173 stop:874 length:702 start_codon:yes stop_codon:yes gene_type:complete
MNSKQENNDVDFWLNNPNILINDICSFNPLTIGSLNYVLNAYSRLIIIITIILMPIINDSNILIYGIVGLVIICFIQNIYSKDNFTPADKIQSIITSNAQNNLDTQNLPRRESDFVDYKSDPNNPLKNILPTEYDKSQDNSGASPSDFRTTKFVDGKVFQTESDYVFDKNTRQYYTMPNTLIPNEQGEFAQWLYGTENNCRSGSIYGRRTGTPEAATNCTGFDVSVPTNFGKL